MNEPKNQLSASRPPRGGLLTPALVALAALSCQEQRVSLGTQLDVVPPNIVISKTAGDTMDVRDGLRFTVGVTDNLGIKDVSIQLSNGYTARIDTTFRTAVTNASLNVSITFPANTSAGGVVAIRVAATDGNNNSAVATDSLYLTNINALIVNLISPLPGSSTSAGKQVVVQVDANQNNGVKKIGWLTNLPGALGDSLLVPPVIPPSIFPDTVVLIDTLTVPAGTTVASFNVSGFAEDSSGRRVLTPAILVGISSVLNDTTPPLVTFTVAKRVEVRDSITVRAIDPSGISQIAWTAVDFAGTPVGGTTAPHGGTVTDVSQTFSLNLAFTTFPQTIIVTASATDAANNVGQSRRALVANSPFKAETLTVVNGITRPIPGGGQIADAIYNRNLNEIYLTNVERNRLEIFSVTDTSFKTPIPVGSKPWGLGMWPRDTLGASADTVVVANSGGTNLSIVDVSLATRRERRRHALPNFLVQTIETELNTQVCPPGGPILPQCIKIKFTEYDFSDRPQYLGMTCRPTTGSVNCGSDSIYAFYSTTPTESQSTGFAGKGTLRWEQVGAPGVQRQSHLFWEHAAIVPGPDSDTLQIIVDRGPGVAPDTVLGGICGATVNINRLAFADSTFVRNSGNFTHGFVGEGGNAGGFARVLSYNGTRGIFTFNCAAGQVAGFPLSGRLEQDLGISPGIRVSDFIANTATPVRAIATNFNGLTNMVRADSIYVLNEALRLAGIIQVTGTNVGTDLNFDHRFDASAAGTPTFGGTLNPNDRLVFSARPDANVDVFDTYFYGVVAGVSLRDPVTGPLRVAKDPVSGAQVLIGVTNAGVVVARLPVITNIFQAPKLWGPPVQ